MLSALQRIMSHNRVDTVMVTVKPTGCSEVCVTRRSARSNGGGTTYLGKRSFAITFQSSSLSNTDVIGNGGKVLVSLRRPKFQ